jgi:hypothetical protein
VLLKTQSKDQPNGTREVLLSRSWIQKENVIPHFANVTKTVGENEGVEITMNCNEEAFDWIISIVKIKSNWKGDSDHTTEVLSEK